MDLAFVVKRRPPWQRTLRLPDRPKHPKPTAMRFHLLMTLIINVKLDLLLLRELSLQGFVGARMRMPFAIARAQRLGPAERGTLPIGVAGGLAPSRQQVDTLLGFSVLARMHRMHIEAVGAAVDLGGTNFHKVGLGPDRGWRKWRGTVRDQSFISSGAAAKGLNLAVMIGFLLLVPTS